MTSGIGLRFPSDLDAWRTWHDGRHPLRQWKTRLRPPAPLTLVHVARRGAGEPRVVAYLDSTSATTMAALVEPLNHLDESVAVVTAFDAVAQLDGPGWSSTVLPTAEAPTGRAVFAGGDYLPLGALGLETSRRAGVPYVVAQHGIMTPLAPPLPPEATLLAWSQADADFWRNGRADVTTAVVGSALLHRAARRPAGAITEDRPLFLGQLHGAELPRRAVADATQRFWQLTGATYRPHPSEWERYGMSPWGNEPTPNPVSAADAAPEARVAAFLRQL